MGQHLKCRSCVIEGWRGFGVQWLGGRGVGEWGVTGTGGILGAFNEHMQS